MDKIVIEWQGGKRFALKDGAPMESLNPRQLMLYALGDCGGIMSVILMEKMRVHPRSVSVEVSGELSGDPQRTEAGYTRFMEVFHVECDPADGDKVRKAVEMTVNEYCGVSLMYKKIGPVEHRVLLNGEK